MTTIRPLTHSEVAALHHHAKWVECEGRGDRVLARRHLYALRAHLHHLGWLAPEYCRPGLGVHPPPES